jgi:hypothetical protein
MSTKKFAPNDWFKDSQGRTVHDVTVQVQVKTHLVAVATTATALPTTPLTDRQFVRVQNVGGSTIYIGGEDVTTSNGWQVLPFSSETFAIEDTVTLYGIVGSSTVNCIVMEGL